MKQQHHHPRAVRLRTSSTPAKTLTQLDDLIRRGHILRSVVIAEYREPEGEVHVVGQNADPGMMAQLLLAAAQALEHIPPSDQPQRQAPPSPPKFEVNTIAKQWATFESDVMPIDVTPSQRKAMRQCFYAGAASLFSMMMSSIDPGREATESDMSRMEGWAGELARFADAIP